MYVNVLKKKSVNSFGLSLVLFFVHHIIICSLINRIYEEVFSSVQTGTA